VPGNLRLACEQFNSGRYFECHETLEELWQEERGNVRDLYKGLIQVAAAFVHVSRGNLKGANRLLRTALGYLDPYRRVGAMGFEIEEFCLQVQRALQSFSDVGVDQFREPDVAIVPMLRWDESRIGIEAVRWCAWGFDSQGHALVMEITTVE
jgi:hypothetical protein